MRVGLGEHREAQERPFPLEPANHGMGVSSTAPSPFLLALALV